MKKQEKITITAAGAGVSVGVPKAPAEQSSTTTAPAPAPFEIAGDLLSKKPLRRPNRTRPLGNKKKRKKK